MLKVGVIGYGYWGTNIVRNFHRSIGARVEMVCDKNPKMLDRLRPVYADITTTTDYMDIINSTEIDAVAVVTPVWAHYELAKKALMNGKHVFVEKPFTCNVSQADELIELAETRGLQIMVDHTFLYTDSVRKIRQFIDNGTLGKLYYYDSTRVNLGLFQHDINVLWDLAPHDLSIMDYLIDAEVEAISATGQKHLNGHEDVAYLTVYFSNKVIAHINVNWLSPVKVRTTLIGGENKMLVWNDLEVDEKIRVYDKGVHIQNSNDVYNLLVSYRSGDMWAPKVDRTEALDEEVAHFVDCVSNGKTPKTDGHAGRRVIQMLEAATRSLQNRGEAVSL
jgi:predicted dehydrogenase